MIDLARIYWGQGTFLQPQHFQQLERSLVGSAGHSLDGVVPHAWGFIDVQVDENLLRIGKFGLSRCRGRFPDGTVFDAPKDCPLPSPVDIGGKQVGHSVQLGIPLNVPGQPDFAHAEAGITVARYGVSLEELDDVCTPGGGNADVEVGRLRLRLLVGESESGGYSTVPLAKIASVQGDSSVRLSDQFIPTVVRSESSQYLSALVRDVHSRVVARCRSMAGRAFASGRLATSEHFLEASMLMAMNRYAPVLAELARRVDMHPYGLYLLLAQAAGELSTFSTTTSAAPQMEPYHHADQYASFASVAEVLFGALGAVIAQSSTQIPLRAARDNYYGAKFPSSALVSPGNQFILCVHAKLDPEALRDRFGPVVKVAAATNIKHLVNNLIPAIPLRLLTTAPPEIRFPSSRSLYYSIDSNSELWSDVRQEKAVGVHVADDFPGLMLELWVIHSAESGT